MAAAKKPRVPALRPWRLGADPDLSVDSHHTNFDELVLHDLFPSD